MNLQSLIITPEILSLIAALDEFKGAWRALGTLAPERLLALRKVATIESIGSSTRIEGNKLSNAEVEKLLSGLKLKSFNTRDEQEVAGYAEVMETIFSSWNHIPLAESVIRQLHRDLLKYSHKDERHRGEYKKVNNHVEAFGENGKSLGVVFQTATPFETPIRMTDLLDWTNNALEEKRLHPLIVIAVFTVVFLEIHPFQDGNGRLSRTITTLLLLKSGYLYVAYSSLESVIEHSKEAYYLALRKTQGSIGEENPDWQPWVMYFLKALQQQKEKLATKVEKEKLMQEKLPELSLLIVELAREHGRVNLNETIAATEGNKHTIKKHIQQLVAGGYLSKQGQGKSTWYTLP